MDDRPGFLGLSAGILYPLITMWFSPSLIRRGVVGSITFGRSVEGFVFLLDRVSSRRSRILKYNDTESEIMIGFCLERILIVEIDVESTVSERSLGREPEFF